jgi:hypothetical protein
LKEIFLYFVSWLHSATKDGLVGGGIIELFGAIFRKFVRQTRGSGHKILNDAGSFVNLALPIVEEIEAEIKALPNQGKERSGN